MELRGSSRRLAEFARWMAQPWRSAGLAVALVASFAVPSLMATSADLFRESAADTISQQLLDQNPGQLGVAVTASGGAITVESIDAMDTALGRRIDDIPLLGEPTRTISVAQVGLSSPVTEEDTRSSLIGSNGTLFQRAGSIGALNVLEGDTTTEGMWISERVAEQFGLAPDDEVTIDDSVSVRIAGVYANLWQGERDPYWNDVPSTLVPTYVSALAGPLRELFVVPESLMTRLGVVGDVRWDAALDRVPDTHNTLVGLAFLYNDIERSYTQSPAVVDALAMFSGAGAEVPTMRTSLFDVRDQANIVVAELEQPIQTTAVAGIIIGLLITSTGAAFAVRKRDTEFRLLRSDGDPGWKFAARAVGQYAPFAIIGAALGVLGAIALVSGFGPPASINRGAIDTQQLVATVVAGLALAAFVTSMMAIRILDRTSASSLRPAWLLLVIGLAIAGWIQVGSASRQQEVDLLVVAFPLVGLAASVGVITLATRAVMRRVRRTGGTLPTALFLAWRRITAAETSALLLSVAMGIALGLMVFSSVLVGSLETASEAKTITVVGGETSLRMVTKDSFVLPERTTIIKRETTLLTIGNATITVLVLDPDTYSDGVSWDPLFGSTPVDMLEALDSPVATADVAAIAVGRRAVPAEGGFGTFSVLSYEVVAELDSIPLASQTFPTLVVRSDHLEAATLRLHERARPSDVDTDDWAALYRSPTLRFANILVSQLDADTLTQDLDARGLKYRDVMTIASQRDVVGNRAARWTFEYLSLLAIIAALSGLGTLLFYLSERRTAVQLSEAMMQRMGLSAATARIAAVVELLGLMVFALIAGTTSALLLANRTFGRFEPDPKIPPDVGLQISLPVLAGIGTGAIAVIVAAGLWSQRSTAQISYSEVLRGT